MTNQEKKLTYKERRFIDFYVTSAKFNGSLAHELAGYKASNPDVRRALASKKVSKGNVKAEIDRRLKEEHENNLELKTEIRRLYEAILRADYDKLLEFRVTAGETKDGKSQSYLYRVPDLSMLDVNLRVAIKVIKKTNNGFTIELYDKMHAAQELRKMYGFDAPIRTKSEIEIENNINEFTLDEIGRRIRTIISEQSEKLESNNDK